jgi:Pyridoxamine 5'-phosphate oxidase
MTTTEPPLGEITSWEAYEFLAHHDVGRICINTGSYPIALPVQYLMPMSAAKGGEQRAVIIRTRPGSEISRALGPASLQVDEVDIGAGRATSVLARGQLALHVDDAAANRTKQWVGYPRTETLALRIESVSGRRFAATGNDQGYAVDWQIDV